LGRLIILTISLVINIYSQSISERSIACRPISEQIKILNTDSLLSNYGTKHSALNISVQALVGEGIGVGAAIIPFSIGFASAFGGSRTTGDIWGAISIPVYIIGTATGVHWIAHIENKEHSYWKTVMFSTIGAGVGAVLTGILASKYTTIPDAGITIIILCPLAGSLIYSLAYADWPQQTLQPGKYEHIKLKNNLGSLKDQVDLSQIIKINLLRISL
jgi:hypothetical protein